jgi:predicted nucleic acid-binding protein
LLNAFDGEDDDDDDDDEDEDKEPILEWLKRKLSSTRRWVIPLQQEKVHFSANGSAMNEVHSTERKVVVRVQKALPHRKLSVASEAGQ